MDLKVILNQEKTENSNLREKYIMNLAKAYINAIGVKTIDLQSELFLEEFNDWLKERTSTMKQYETCLNYMELAHDFPMTAEIGKGLYDSVASLNDRTTIITPYTFDLKRKCLNRIIPGTITIGEATSKKPSIEEYIDNLDTFMTQNPYHKKDIKHWDLLYKYLQYHIIVGVYGKDYDKDKEQKLKMLKDLKERINSEKCQDHYVRINDDYMYILATTGRKYQKIKAKH